MGKSGSGKVGTSQESRRGNGKKATYNYIPLPKMLQMGIATGKEQERERILQWIANNDIGRCCFESHDLVAFIKGENV